MLTVEPGWWAPPRLNSKVRAHFGLLMLDGVILRRLTVAGRTGAELLGSGDLLQPWLRQPPHDTLVAEPGWKVLERSRLAVLDHRFASRVSAWPEIAAALVTRALERGRSLAFQHVASSIPRVETRLVALMWSLADRWGRVTPSGVLVTLRLTHATLAELVGASRPSVSTALSRLAGEGVLVRRADGWLLNGAGHVHDPGAGVGAPLAVAGGAAGAAG